MQSDYTKTKMFNYLHRGYIALTAVLVVTVLVLVIGVTTSILSVGDIQSSYSSYKNEDVLSFVEGCAEDALMRLNKNGSLPGSVTLPLLGTCTVTLNSQIGATWNFSVSGTLDNYTKKITVEAQKSGSISITSWKEEI
jgi:hypothetical protein